MSEIFQMDVNGDGVDDLVVAQEFADGSIVTAADTDGDGLLDVAAYDADGDGVQEVIVEEDPGTLDATAGQTGEQYPTTPDYTSEYAGDAGYAGDGGYAGDAGESYADPAMVSDMLAMQHETNMTIINNMA